MSRAKAEKTARRRRKGRLVFTRITFLCCCFFGFALSPFLVRRQAVSYSWPKGVKVDDIFEENISWLLTQLFTESKWESFACESTIQATITASWADALKLCVHTPRCHTVDRHILSGITRICMSNGRLKSSFLKLWASRTIGGCSDLHDDVVQLFHKVSNTDAACGLLGLNFFLFKPQPHALSCSIAWQGLTHSLQQAAQECLANQCGFLVRRQTGETFVCLDETRDQQQQGVSLTIPGQRLSVVAVNQAKDHLKGEILGDAIIGVHKGKVVCNNNQILMQGIYTHSVEHAKLLCAAEPFCTAFARELDSQVTYFCQGYAKFEMSPINSPYISGIFRGCEVYRGEQSFADAFAGVVPNCASLNENCGQHLHAFQLSTEGQFDTGKQRLCDECPHHGLCPRLQLSRNMQRPSTTDEFAQMLEENANALLGKDREQTRVKAMNPSIFEHLSELYVVVRASDAHRCFGISKDQTWQTDKKLTVYSSFLMLCKLQSETLLPISNSCLRYDLPDEQVEPENMGRFVLEKKTGFRGPEDPRGFSHDGKIMILVNAGVELNSGTDDERMMYPSGIIERHIFVLVLDRYSLSRIIHLDFHRRGDTKNVVPLTWDSRIQLIYQMFPFRFCTLDLEIGSCTNIELKHYPTTTVKEYLQVEHKALPDLEKLGKWRGSTQFVHTRLGFLGLIHRKQDLELGRVYTHKFVLLSENFPHVPVWVSEPFRFPKVHETYDDIQFAAGMVLKSPGLTALVSFGVADCVSAVAALDIPELSKLNEEPRNSLDLIRKPATQLKSMDTFVVRWEGPVTDLSSFAGVARRVCEGLTHVPWISLQIRNLDIGRAEFEPDRYSNVYSRIITSNEELSVRPDLIIRFHWPPNFQVSDSKLVVYLPWEFYHIPKTWVQQLNSHADEIWTPSRHSKEGFASSGVKEFKVHVVPHGVSCRTRRTYMSFYQRPEEKTILKTSASLKLLYHGGMLRRKGLDLILRAFHSAFSRNDDVVLVIHSVYGDEDMQKWVKEYLEKFDDELAEVEMLQKDLSEVELSTLYSTCDVLVHLSRSEGFGLGVIEAMSMGLPVIVPAAPPLTDFVTEENGFIVPSFEKVCDAPPCLKNGSFFKSPDWDVPKYLLWHEFDVQHAADVFREIYLNQKLLLEKRKLSQEHACTYWDWNQAHDKILERIQQISLRSL